MSARFYIIAASLLLFSGCMQVELPVSIKSEPEQINIKRSEDNALKAWWGFFNDDVLSQLVSSAIQMNNARVDEGVEFGENSISKLAVQVSREYVDFRYLQNQEILLEQYIRDRKSIYTSLNTHRELSDARLKAVGAEIDALEGRKADITKRSEKHIQNITNLTKLLPEYVEQVLNKPQDIIVADIIPFLAAPTTVLASATKVQNARIEFAQNVNSKKAYLESENIFGMNMIGGFFGVSDEVYAGGNTPWQITLGTGVRNINMSALEGKYSEKDLAQLKDKTSDFVMDIEHKIVNFTHMRTQYIALNNQAEVLNKAYLILKEQDREVDKIRAQDEADRAKLASMKAHTEMVKTIIDLYDMLDVY